MIKQELIIKKSTFVSYVYEINDKKEVKHIIEKLRKEHKKARHVCYGYLINNGSETAGFSDDGEPKNTAGRPIYEIIKLKNQTNILVVVVRYFGGILLGAGGLIRAYRQGAADAINSYILEKEKQND
ncbi:YigZ family protein [Mycoplasma sp. Pen4]|uniref:YigZ family protein n=1 Tax=Mycoplasma sp. Pen4 TaxID=640330 RepID=UPI0016541D00|nr:YigZ family protein [Mycoplasma sp. Pen4]QNM93930.1 YigZ family protein [Mycoplasma sp. Pen4]